MFDRFLDGRSDTDDAAEDSEGSSEQQPGGRDDSETELEDLAEREPTQEEGAYRFEQVESEIRQGKEVAAIGTGDTMYAGEWVREIFEGARERPQQATWAGYVDDAVRGIRPVPIEFEALFRHIAVFGTTGYGKTALLINLMIQWAYAGYGFCFLDPKGDAALDLMQRLPDHRLEDVIWIEPTPSDHDQVVGLNFLEAGEMQSEIELEHEIESILSDLKAILRGEEYWGPTMNAIVENIGRTMIRSNRPYTILDMYFVLADEDRRQIFADTVDDEVVREYTQKIAEMDDETIDPVLKRLQTWVENRITREIVAHRESSVNIKEAVEEGKIIVVRNTVDSQDMKQMNATGIMRRIWAAIKARDGIPEEERTPYFMVVDEFDDVVSEDANVDKMLSKARSMRMSVTLANQQPSQLPESIQKAMFGNCDNLLALNPNEPADARIIMKRFGDYTTEDLLNLGRFKLFTRIMVNAERSDPFISHTFPEYPPLRTREEARDAIERSLDRHGVDRLDPTEITNDLIIEADDTTTPTEGDDQEPSPGQIQQTVLEAVFTAQVRDGTPEGWVSADAVSAELEARLSDAPFTSQVSQLIEQVPETLVEMRRHDGTLQMKLTSEGRSQMFTQDTGGTASSGGLEHRHLLRRAFETFTRIGFTVELPTQHGREQPDGLADLPIDPGSETLAEAQTKETELKEKYPAAYAVSDGMNLIIESETTTVTKPMQIVTNLAKAIDVERRCVFAVPDGEQNHGSFEYWARRGENILTDPPFVSDIDEAGNRTFYNKNERVEASDGVYALRPTGSQSVWREEGDSLVLLDSDGTEYARFDDLEQFLAASPVDFPATYEYTDGDYVVKNLDGSRVYKTEEALTADWKRIPVPFIPEHEFSRQPLASDWIFVIFPDDDKDRPPQIYDSGEVRPISPDLDSLESDESDDREQPINGDQDPPSSDSQEQAGSRQDDTDSTTDGSCEHGNDPETCIWCNA